MINFTSGISAATLATAVRSSASDPSKVQRILSEIFRRAVRKMFDTNTRGTLGPCHKIAAAETHKSPMSEIKEEEKKDEVVTEAISLEQIPFFAENFFFP